MASRSARENASTLSEGRQISAVVTLEHHRTLHQLGVLQQQIDHCFARRVVGLRQAQLGEALVLAHELRRLVGNCVEDALEIGAVERVLQVLDDVELDATVVEGSPSRRVTVLSRGCGTRRVWS